MATKTKTAKASKTDSKMISISQWEKLLEDNTEILHLAEKDPQSADIVVKKRLSLADFWDAVDEVAEMCAPNVNLGTEEAPQRGRVFTPENREFALRRIVVSKYANFRLPQDYAQQYKLLYQTPVYNRIIHHIDQQQLQELAIAADRKVEFYKESMLSVKNLLDGIVEKVVGVLESLGDIDAAGIQKALGLLTDTKSAGEAIMQQALQEATEKQNAESQGENAGVTLIK